VGKQRHPLAGSRHQGQGQGDHPLAALIHLGHTLAAWATMAPGTPTGDLLANFGGGDALVVAVVPLAQILTGQGGAGQPASSQV